MKNSNDFYEALRHLSRNENVIQKAWEVWNNVKWETEFNYDDLKEGDCVVFSDYTIAFVDNGAGKAFAAQNGGFVLYQHQTRSLMEVQELIDIEMNELKATGFGSEDC